MSATLPMASVTAAILDEIRRDGLDVRTHTVINSPSGRRENHAKARDLQTDEAWRANASDPDSAAFELATMLGWEFD